MRRRWLVLLELLLLAALCTWLVMSLRDRTYRPDGAIDIKVQLQGARDRAYLYEDAQTRQMWYLIYRYDGLPMYLNPEDFARWVHHEQQSRSMLAALLNVTSPIGFWWVMVGLLGQLLFTGRMIVQWLVSEKEKRSVVPPVFWWMSLVGATMLLVYFMWRWDPIGILGQAFGWFIYVRNLWLIYRKPSTSPSTPSSSTGNGTTGPSPNTDDDTPTIADDPGPEAELNK